MSNMVTLGPAWGVLRGVMLTAGLAAWLRGKLRGAATDAERSLLWMVSSRSALLGLCLLALSFAGRPEPLGWVLAADGVLQVFDAAQAARLSRRALAVMPAALCVLDAAAVALLWS